MPLVRVQVRNEYGLGQPELYREANREDPKDVLDGVAVAGLVGILRQLGDLAEFAAEVFHGLQEQVTTTSSRSHKMMVRIQCIEGVLPPLEKAILAQKSHLHFAYTAGSVWHPRLQNEQNNFIYGDLPRFIMDSYEESRDPPRLHLLDKFDTGGAGSCLKRYSDPTFFRKASTSSVEGNVEKVSKARKANRSKKNRTWKRNEVSRGASISNHSDRTQFTSRNVDGQVSPPQTVSALDAIFRSDLRDQSNSFDSRTGSDYIECVFHPTYSMKPEEHEPKESSFSSLRMHHNDIVDSASVDDHSGVVDDDFPHILSHDQIGSGLGLGPGPDPGSSCVTWDEKTEILETVGHEYDDDDDDDETVEMLTMNFTRDSQEHGAGNFGGVDPMDFQFDNEDTPTSVSGRNPLDDIESEPDNYMDALNTIESESETDLDYQTKRKVEQSSNFMDEETQDEICGLTADQSDLQPSMLESCNTAHSSSNITVSIDEPNSISSECYADEDLTQIAEKSSDMSSSLGMDLCRNKNILDGSNTESIVSNSPSSGLTETSPKVPMSDKMVKRTSCESQKPPAEPPGVPTVKFWTNGNLLGLEPSKPPDFSVQNAEIQDSVTRSKDNIVSGLSQSNVLNGNGEEQKTDKSVQSFKIVEQISAKNSSSLHNDQDGNSDKKASWRLLLSDKDAKRDKSGDSHPSSRFDVDNVHRLSETSAGVPETERSVTSDVRAISAEDSQRDGDNEFHTFGLRNRILVNGFQRKVSLVHREKSEPPSSMKTGVSEQNSRNQSGAYQANSDRNFNVYLGSASPINSPSSSPPLQHMKIFFQPINGFETSKLKLKFRDGSYGHDGSRDMLPSFQLVPEPATPQRDSGADSDDDTFCRLSPYMSDDGHSHHSDSNSEQWESDDTPRSKNNELYDALRRISSTEFISSYAELDRTGHGGSLDLPSLSTLNPLFVQEMKNGSDVKAFPKSDLPKEEDTPLPPPLPPLQWQVMKSHSDLTIRTQDSVSETLNHALEMKILGSTISPQSMRSPAKQQLNTDEAIAFTQQSRPESHKLNGQKEFNQATNGRGADEREDFLHQIRTKSFNLRRTATEKPIVTPVPAANVKVTAILEKANAIRQAVGSDYGEDDDNWSDT
ncbi:protein SCAR3-like isoform X1 [Actinidia eriantha]|uniref:protein SCAR3-like isoform X1 n=2 Tax=Actinidia eriantha TaxID=165200 RepID=UPI00258B7B6A|nr:protein SCAR3-like isoform X1 [Actinidia eriantha]